MSDPRLGACDGPVAELRFEPVGPKHADALVELFERNAVAAVSASFDPFPLTRRQAQWIARESRMDIYYIAMLGREAVGMSMLRGFDEGYETPSFGVFVDHRNHGRGIGRRLTTWTIGQARARGCPAVRLSVYAWNTTALGLYVSLGFQELEREILEQGGTSVEKIVMRLDLGG